MQHTSEELIGYVKLLPPNVWLSSKDLNDLWEVTLLTRKAIIKQLVDHNLMERKGHTTTIRYRTISANKSKKKASGLADLINAAARIGEENESLKQTLRTIDAAIAKVREFL